MSENESRDKFLFKAVLKKMLEPLYAKLETIDFKLKGQQGLSPKKFYRNEDLKKIFGLSNNTIIKYRQTGVLPYTKLGDIFLYDATKIDEILKDNQT
jgi:hypothetical protein